MAKSNITPEKLAQVAKLVAEQKAKADALKANSKKSLKPAGAAKATKEVDEAKAAKQAEREKVREARAQEREVKKAELDKVRAAKKAEREAKKAEREAARANKTPAWVRKIDRLEAALPPVTDNLAALRATISKFSDVELTSALAYVEFERRSRGIRASAALKAEQGQVLNVGDKVAIKNCSNRKFIGQVGVVSLVRRIRAFVTVPGFSTEAYVFTSDVDVLEPYNAEELGSNILDEQSEAPEAGSVENDEPAVESTGTEG